MSCPKYLLYYQLNVGMRIGRQRRISKRNGKIIRSDKQSICSPIILVICVSQKRSKSLTDAFDTGNLLNILDGFFILYLDHH